MYILTYRLFLERVNSSYVCVYTCMSIYPLHIAVVIQLYHMNDLIHLYSVTLHIWRLNSRKRKTHSVNDYPHSPPHDG